MFSRYMSNKSKKNLKKHWIMSIISSRLMLKVLIINTYLERYFKKPVIFHYYIDF